MNSCASARLGVLGVAVVCAVMVETWKEMTSRRASEKAVTRSLTALRMASDLRRTIVNGAEADGSADRTNLELVRRNAIGADIRAQGIGNHDASVSLLIVLNDRDPGVHEFALLRSFRTIANVGTTRLKRLEVRTG